MTKPREVELEYRRAKQFASKCKLKGNPPFFVVEACEEDWTYSAVHLAPKSDDIPFEIGKRFEFDFLKLEQAFTRELNYCHPGGKNALLIGVNPRPRNEVGDHPICSLETTRRKTIFALSQICDLKVLITVDIFAKRTNTTAELFDLIEGVRDKELIEKDYVGLDNKKLVEQLVNDCDYIVLGWGNGLSGDRWSKDYLESYRSVLYNECVREKCRWFGPNKDGSPQHPASSNAKELYSIKESEFRGIFE